jgi:UTP--glucose-1-phosphate uridylyltransferase
LEEFYNKLEDSLIMWINQPEPKGFGHAVLMAKPYVKNETFLVHAGDTYIMSSHEDIPLKRMLETHNKNKSDATLLLKKIKNPKQYGIADVQENKDTLIVRRVIEKPEKPSTDLAIMPIYIFNNTILTALEKTSPGLGGEIQLTDAIQHLINDGLKVQAIKLRDDEIRLDVGNPETYWEAINESYKNIQKHMTLHKK